MHGRESGLESIFVIYFQNHKDVRGSGLQVFSLFSNVDLLAWCRGYAVDYIACKSIIDVDGPYRCRDPVSVLGERTSVHLKGPDWLMDFNEPLTRKLRWLLSVLKKKKWWK